MRRSGRGSGFFSCLLFNMILNPQGAVVSAALVVLHFVFGWSLWWALLAFGVWILYIIVTMLILGWANKCDNEPPQKTENKNPYSAGKGFGDSLYPRGTSGNNDQKKSGEK